MNMSIEEVVDKVSIYRVKRENGIDVSEYLAMLEAEASHVDISYVEELYHINKAMWPYHDLLLKFPNRSWNEKLAVMLIELNAMRSKIKNEIAERYGGVIDKKTYA